MSVHAQTAHFAGVETAVASTGLSNPHQIAVDPSGNVYIADVGNNRVLKETLTAGGYQESVVASTGLKTPAGVAVDANGNVFVADSGNNRVLEEQLSGSAYTEIVLPISGLNTPISIAVDGSDNLYISDWGNARVVKETLSGSNYSQSLVLGGPNPDGVAVDANGNVYICAPNYGIVYKMAPVGSGYSESMLGGGWSSPHGVTVNQLGVAYVADSGNSQIVMEVPNGSGYTQTVLLPTGSVGPQAMAVDVNGNLYFNDPTGGRVLKLTQTGANLGTSSIGIPSAAASIVFSFDSPGAISSPSVVTQGVTGADFTDAGTGSCTTNGTDHVYQVADTCTVDVIFTPKHAGVRYGAALLGNSSGVTIATAYVTGTGIGPLLNFIPGTQDMLHLSGVTTPLATAVDGSGNLYVSQWSGQPDGLSSVYKETWNGSGYTSTQIATGFTYPWSLTVDGAGNVYVSDLTVYSVFKLTPSANGTYTKSFFAGEGANTGVAVDGAGNVYIGTGASGLQIFYASDGFSNITSRFVAGNIYVSGLAVDNAGNIYIANDSQNEVVKVTPSGSGYVQSTLISGSDAPSHIAVDGLGNLYISGGFGNGYVYKETLTGSSYVQSTLATGINDPVSVSVDGSGNVYYASAVGGSVGEINYATPPVLHFAATAVGQTSSDSPQTVTIQNNGNAPMNVPQLTQGSNPSIPSGFTVDDSASSSCPLVDENSSSAGMLATGASCNLTISFSPQLSTDTSGWLTYTYDAPDETNPSYQATSIPLIAGGAKLTSTLTWTNPASIVYGTKLSPLQLNANANVPGTFSYSPAMGSILTAGSHTLSVTFTPADSTDFTTTTAQVTINVTQATPSVSWTAPAAITYGTALSSTQLNASSPVAGTFSYSSAAGAVLSAGSHTLSVTFTPTDTTDYTAATAEVVLTVNQATPTITWPAPSAITYGTALSSVQLNASSPVAGTFSYFPADGTTLTAGSQMLTAVFIPTDSTDYSTVSASVPLIVNQATPTITWATPADITYGMALNAAQLNATASVAGTFSYSQPIGAVLSAGSHTLTTTFIPTDSTDYKTATESVTLKVNQATPAITWAPPLPITYGTALSTAQLNAVGSVPGVFTYSPPAGTVLTVGSHAITASFTPTDSVDYVNAKASITLIVNQAKPAITWSAPASISYGTALGAQQLNATASVPGAFTYSPAAGTVLEVGMHTITVTFTPTDTANYATTSTTTAITVTKATPAITWTAPPSITYGTTLGSAQLNANSNIAGTFAYTPALGTVLTAGVHTLSVTFTPSDSTDYNLITTTVPITVNQATPTVTWITPAAISFGTALGAAQLNATASVPGTFAYNPSAGTIPPIGNDTLSVTFIPADATDYIVASAKVMLAVVEPTPVVSSLLPAVQAAGNAAFTLTVNGSGFTAASVVYWGTTALTTQYVSGTQLTVQVPATDIASAGTNAVTVLNPTPGGGTSNPLQFEVDSAGGSTPPAFTTVTATVTPGATATYSVTLPSSATNVSATCLNLPAGAACAYSATTGAVSITTSSKTPAGTYQITVVFSETLPETTAAMVLAPVFLLPLAFKKRQWKGKQVLFLVTLGIALTIAITGCGGGGGSSPHTQTHTVTSSGTVSLTVQ